MSLFDRLRGIVGTSGATIRVHVLIRGRIGEGWHDVDEAVRVRDGMTLGEFIDFASDRGMPLRQALADSPHLRDTLMWNGERSAVAEHADQPLADGDTIYLLAPLAGG
jgi:molybdopterin converting factor small subunit